MDDENTVWQPVEPTMPVSKYPYEPTAHAPNPYENAIPIPPPPPRKPRRNLGVLLVIAILLFSAAGLFSWTYIYHVNTTQPTPIVRFVPVTPTPTPFPTDTPTPVPTVYANYSASDIMADFVQSGRQVTSVSYGMTLWNWSGSRIYTSHHATSSVQWVDSTDTSCGGPCSLGLWVYDDAATSAQVYVDINSAERTLSSNYQWPAYQQGRCVLMNSSVDGPYAVIVQKYCV